MTQMMITPQRVKEVTAISKRIQLNDDLSPSIIEAQIKYVRPVLGDELYNEVIADIATGSPSQATLDLLAQGERMIAFYVVYEALPYIHYKTTDAGVVQWQGANYQASDSGYGRIAAAISSSGETHRVIFVEWLQKNVDTYPLFRKSTYFCGDTSRQTMAITSNRRKTKNSFE